MQQMQVMCRVRPLTKREQDLVAAARVEVDPTAQAIELQSDQRTREHFALDGVFWQNDVSQAEIYQKTGHRAADALFEGFNGCVFAYGQTGSGKTFTMMGTDDAPGIIPRIVDDVFARKASLEAQEQTIRLTLSCSFFEIYNEKVRDLLVTRNSKSMDGIVTYAAPRVRQHPTRGVFVEGLECIEAQSADDVIRMIKRGAHERATSSTNSNATSSRSHAIFQLVLRYDEGVGKTTRVSTASLVDLAGSERVNRTGATGATLEELKNINSSLTTLKRVLEALDPKNRAAKTVVPYRDSVLTHVLSEALNGNSYTLMLAMISPARDDYDDTLNTLRFAAQARRIVLHPKMNQRRKSMAVTNAMQEEIEQLRQQLSVASVEHTELREELEVTLQSRQEELTQLVASQQSLEDRVREYEERERQMHNQMKQISQERDLFKIAVSEQKRERFAAAFRNAFRNGSKKKEAVEKRESNASSAAPRRVTIADRSTVATYDPPSPPVSNVERDEMAASVDDYFPQRVAFLEEQVDDLQRQKADVEAREVVLEEQFDELQRQKAEADARIAALEEQNRSLMHAVNSLVSRRGRLDDPGTGMEPRLFSPSKAYNVHQRNLSCASQLTPPPRLVTYESRDVSSPIVDVSRSEVDFALSATIKPDEVVQVAPEPAPQPLAATQSADNKTGQDNDNIIRILQLESRCDALMTELWHAERALDAARREDAAKEEQPIVSEPSPVPTRTPSVVPPLKFQSRALDPTTVAAWKHDSRSISSIGHHRRSVSQAAYHSDTMRVL